MTMLGRLIASLDDPAVAAGLVAAVDDPALLGRLAAAAKAAGEPEAVLVASAVRNFVETASDDLWTQLIGIMNRAEDPGLAAMRAILTKAFPPTEAARP
jgi:hypothetical protein